MHLKSILIAGLICLIALALASTSQAQTTANSATPVEWKRYELGSGTFSILLPGKPVEQIKSAKITPTLSVQMRLYAVSVGQGAYITQYNLLSEEAEGWTANQIEVFYNGVWDGVVKGISAQLERGKLDMQVTLAEKRKTKVSGYDGREVLFNVGQLKGRIVMALVGRHAFTAMALGSEDMTAADRNRFFNSFTIKMLPVGRKARK